MDDDFKDGFKDGFKEALKMQAKLVLHFFGSLLAVASIFLVVIGFAYFLSWLGHFK
jgi:hypothetical protein